MSEWRQQEECEERRWNEEAHWLSLDADKRYLKWLEDEDRKFDEPTEKEPNHGNHRI